MHVERNHKNWVLPAKILTQTRMEGRAKVIKGVSILTLLHFVAFFHVASLFSTGVDNEKALELTNSTVFHRGRQ